MNGFAKVPTALASDRTLTIGARATYPVVAEAAWRAGRRRETDGVALPSVDALARELGCSRTAMTGYLKELREQGWIHAVRKTPRRPARWWILERRNPDFQAPASDQNLVTDDAGSDQNLVTETRGCLSIEKLDRDLASLDLERDVPRLVKTAGQDVALNTLLDECGIDPKSPRVVQAVTAMNGRRGQRGIRALFWLEAVRWCSATGNLAELDRFREAFEGMLATRVRQKAARYRQRMPAGTMVTPTALLSHWLDLELATARAGAALTGDDIRRLAS